MCCSLSVSLVCYNFYIVNFQVLHYLETLQPHELLEQMVCTAFRAAADTLCQTSYGELKQVETEMKQLYVTMASTLRPWQGIYSSNFLFHGKE